jgi:hypothetical protein
MIFQLHHQFNDGHTEFISQREIIPTSQSDMTEQMHRWIEETTKEFPLPEGAIWVCGNEKWEHFMWMSGHCEPFREVTTA